MQVRKYLNNYFRLILLGVLSIAFISWTFDKADINAKAGVEKLTVAVEPKLQYKMELIYDSLELENKGLSHTAFSYALSGFAKLQEEGALKNDSVVTIIDFDQPSYKKRLYIIDIKNFKVLFNTLVAHGKNTGKEMAEFFSNTRESLKSSLGFYITDETYRGSKGYSLKLRGVEPSLNTNAMRRAIVIHGAPYVSQSYIDAQGYIGRSHGCPAIPTALTKPIIQTIKDGSCLFIYNKSYKPSPMFSEG